MLKGIAASSGIAIGKALMINNTAIEVSTQSITPEDTIREVEKFTAALKTAIEELEEIRVKSEKEMGTEYAAIFEAHILILKDEELLSAVSDKILSLKNNAEFALKSTIDEYVSLFSEMDNEYMKERAADLKDIGDRLLRIMLNIKNVDLKNIEDESILIARDLTPSDTASMNKAKVLGFITEIGGPTSHTAIMARTMEIPAVLGLSSQISEIKTGDTLILDGSSGLIYINPEDTILRDFMNKKEELEKQSLYLKKYKDKPSESLDGKKVEIAANIGRPKDIDHALDHGADGVGLFRTEFLYMDKSSLPTEEEQFEAYSKVLKGMGDRPVVIRTLDIGGDKKLPYLPIEEEMNPFLGYRAIRLCLDQRDIFKTQLNALLRASVYGNLKIMFPMISSLEELLDAKSILAEVKEDLRNKNITYSDSIEIGIMIEIPSAAIMSDILAAEIDFMSIGTNDLIQYTVAVDRMNEKVSYLYTPYNPAVLRLIKLVINNAHKNNIWVGMCGEAAGDINLIPLLLGLGLDEFSMAAPSILKARKLIGSLNINECEALVDEVMKLSTSEKIGAKLKDFVASKA